MASQLIRVHFDEDCFIALGVGAVLLTLLAQMGMRAIHFRGI